MPSFSAVILASRPGSLRLCLESLFRAAPARDFECLLVLNGDDDACAAVAADFPGLRVIRGAPKTLGGARNAAVVLATGDWLCFLDDDVQLPESYFSTLDAKIRLFPEAAVIGGPNLTPPASAAFQSCAGAILASPLSAGPLARRCGGLARDSWTDDGGVILCNLCVRREIFSRDGLRFDEELARNEENLLLARLALLGRRVLHCPDLFVYHERRATLMGFLRQCFLSGQGRGEMTVKLPGSLKALHLLPLLPLLGLPGLLLLPRFLLAPAAAYMALAALNAALFASGPRMLGWLLLLYPAAHLSYGTGLLAGLASGVSRRLKAAPSLTPHAAR